MVEPRDEGLVLWTLRFADEVCDPKDDLDKIRAETPNAKALGLISKLIDERKSHWEPAMTQDPVQTHLLDIISGRTKEHRTARGKKQAPASPGNVVNIMDALRKSIDAEKHGSKRR
jgi:DNA end-binding protein Ku